MPDLKVFEPALFAEMLQRRGGGAGPGDWTQESAIEAKRDLLLATLASDARGGLRDVLVATSNTTTRLKQLVHSAPNCAEIIGVVMRAAEVSRATRSELRLPPILLIGPPGVGKTHLAHELAKALKIKILEYPMNCADDSGSLVGHSLSWRGARVGLVARALIEGDTASPLIFVDEIDKPLSTKEDNLLDPLHALLEPENARSFVDVYLEAPLRADKLIWIATANDISALKPSLIDRFLVISVPAPDPDDRAVILQNIYLRAIAPYGAAIEDHINRDVICALSDATPRRMRMLLELAIGYAVSDKRRHLCPADVIQSRQLVEASGTKPRIGFFR